MKVLLQIAFRNLVQARKRSLVLGAAIALVTFLLVILLALTAGMNDAFFRSVTTLASGHVNVTGFWKPTPGSGAYAIMETDRIRQVVAESAPPQARVTDRLVGLGSITSARSNIRNVVLTGIDPQAEEQNLRSYLTEGEPATLLTGKTAMLFEAQARRLDVEVGDVVTARAVLVDGQVNTVDLTVAAIAADRGLVTSWTVMTPRENLESLFGYPPGTTSILRVELDQASEAPEVLNQLRTDLDAAGERLLPYDPVPYFWKLDRAVTEDWEGQSFDVTTWRDEVSYLAWIFDALDAVVILIITILLGIVNLGIINTMMMATRERAGEIGTMRAIGIQRWAVVRMIAAEAALLGLMATTFGAILGAGAAVALDAAQISIPSEALREILLADVFHLRVNISHLLASIGLATSLTLLAAAWPALRAAKLEPAIAMQKAVT